ncbi:DEAD/DEAH box helicase [Microlunatus elymi]|uniref:DEAD/DEAH box helicase n=1 Tax=Microlunatus elymi TaxID=2596828 RepID=UPI00143DCC4B|nr:DEAD/DEAH box helicase family protein [Microlunatus elymi]
MPQTPQPPPWASVGYPLPLRPHQQQALAAIERAWQTGADRAWVVLPPGAGKTVVGLEAARRRGRPTVVLSPNTAIQGQWMLQWGRFVPAAVRIGNSRDLSTPLTSLTYQTLAVFDPDAEVDEEGRPDGQQDHSAAGYPDLLDRLHPNGRALVTAMQELGPMTLFLDECHHLLEVWGRLIADVLTLLPDASVIGLTATPPQSLTSAESQLVDELFGRPLYSASIPSLVRSGYLAPFAELAWLVRPTDTESEWLASQAERFLQLQTDLTDPANGSIGLLAWLDARFVRREVTAGDSERAASADGIGPVALNWYDLERDEPDLAAAALRFHYAGLIALPPGARLREQHRHQPTSDDMNVPLPPYRPTCAG